MYMGAQGCVVGKLGKGVQFYLGEQDSGGVLEDRLRSGSRSSAEDV